VGLIRRNTEPQAQEPTPDPPSVDTLMTQLDDPEPECRREAALSLDGVTDAVPALLQRVGVETELTVRDAVLTTLAAHDTDEVARALAGYLASDDAALRTSAAEAMATMPDSAPALMPALIADPDHDVRVMTAMVLADLPHPGSTSWLATMISEDSHPNVVTAAIDALLPMAGAEHIALLEAAMWRFPDDPFLRFTVEKAMPRLTGTPR
jgi:HEAT repeat protein